MESSGLLITLIVLMVIGLIIMFFIIKGAIVSGIKDYNDRRFSGTDLDVKLIKIVSEIAKANGVPDQKIDSILNGKSAAEQARETLKK